MAIEPADAQQAEGLDQRFLMAALALEVSVQQLLDDTADEMVGTIIANTRGNDLQNADAVTDAMIVTLVAFFVAYSTLVSRSAGTIAGFKAAAAVEDTVPYLRAGGAFDAANAFKTEVAGYEESITKRFAYRTLNGRTFTQRIKTIAGGSEKTVRNIVANGVRNGLGAREIAKGIQQYVNPVPGVPKVQPWKIYRDRFNRPASFIPKGVQAGTVQTNVMMIARTESAEVYRQATDDFYRSKSWIAYYEWVLSNSHPLKDICDEYAAKKWGVKEKRPFSHPHCLCDWVARPVTMTELRELVARGKV